MSGKLQEKLDYRITVLSSYPTQMDVYALVVVDKMDNRTLERISRYAEVKKAFPFLNAAKVRGGAKDIARLANEGYVRFIFLDHVVGESN